MFSYRDRPVHLGPYPLERLRRTTATHNDSALPPMQALRFITRVVLPVDGGYLVQ